MRLLVTGSRDWTWEGIIKRYLIQAAGDAREVTLLHGDARGADRIAAKWAASLGWSVEAYPANWNRDGLSAGPKRNQQMLDVGKPDKVIAFPLPQSKGTWDMVNRARKAGLPVIVCNER